MKIANVKALVAKILTAGFLAGAVAMVAPTKAQAEEVFIGNGGIYARHDFHEQRRFEFDRRDAFRRPEFRRFDHERFHDNHVSRRGYR